MTLRQQLEETKREFQAWKNKINAIMDKTMNTLDDVDILAKSINETQKDIQKLTLSLRPIAKNVEQLTQEHIDLVYRINNSKLLRYLFGGRL